MFWHDLWNQSPQFSQATPASSHVTGMSQVPQGYLDSLTLSGFGGGVLGGVSREDPPVSQVSVDWVMLSPAVFSDKDRVLGGVGGWVWMADRARIRIIL